MIQIKKFQRKIEDFVCENCGFLVKGDGYTNHCPRCLYSKHVDVNPGDRLEICWGLMEPIGVDFKNMEDRKIIHKCIKCGEIRRCKVSEDDDFDVLLSLMNK